MIPALAHYYVLVVDGQMIGMGEAFEGQISCPIEADVLWFDDFGERAAHPLVDRYQRSQALSLALSRSKHKKSSQANAGKEADARRWLSDERAVFSRVAYPWLAIEVEERKLGPTEAARAIVAKVDGSAQVAERLRVREKVKIRKLNKQIRGIE